MNLTFNSQCCTESKYLCHSSLIPETVRFAKNKGFHLLTMSEESKDFYVLFFKKSQPEILENNESEQKASFDRENAPKKKGSFKEACTSQRKGLLKEMARKDPAQPLSSEEQSLLQSAFNSLNLKIENMKPPTPEEQKKLQSSFNLISGRKV